MANDPREKIGGILDALVADETERRQRFDLAVAEIRALMGGEATIGERLKRVKGTICAAWSEAYKERCDFDHVKHTGWLKKKMTEHGDDVVIAKYHSYLANGETFYVKARHPFGMFMTNFNTWRGLPSEPVAASSQTLRELRGES